MATSRVPPPGVWTPAVTFFDPETDHIDFEAQSQYYAYLSKTGLAGLVVLGTNAETFLVATARQATHPKFPIMADAADAGADFALVLPPAYFGAATTAQVVENFFTEISSKSRLPIVLYNFPGVCNGVDIDSALITRLANQHANIVGVKLTCGSVANITRLAAALPKARFATIGGQSDFLLGGLSSGSSGCIAAFGNVFPSTIVQIYNLYQGGKLQEALELHQTAALAEKFIKGGIGATKYAAAVHSAKQAGIKNAASKLKPRRPYVEPSHAVKSAIVEGMAEVAEIANSLALASTWSNGTPAMKQIELAGLRDNSI